MKNSFLLHQNYVEKGLSLAEIAREFFCSKNAVRNAILRAGIPLRGKQEIGRSSNIRYGLKRTKGYPVEERIEQKVIQTIVDMRDEGISFPKIAKFLTGAGVSTKTRRRKWHCESVRRIFFNRQNQISGHLGGVIVKDK